MAAPEPDLEPGQRKRFDELFAEMLQIFLMFSKHSKVIIIRESKICLSLMKTNTYLKFDYKNSIMKN